MNKCPTCGNQWEEICEECQQAFAEEVEYQMYFGDNQPTKINISSGEDVLLENMQ